MESAKYLLSFLILLLTIIAKLNLASEAGAGEVNIYGFQSAVDNRRIVFFFTGMEQYKRLGVNTGVLFLINDTSGTRYPWDFSMRMPRRIYKTNYYSLEVSAADNDDILKEYCRRPKTFSAALRGRHINNTEVCEPSQCPNMMTKCKIIMYSSMAGCVQPTVLPLDCFPPGIKDFVREVAYLFSEKHNDSHFRYTTLALLLLVSTAALFLAGWICVQIIKQRLHMSEQWSCHANGHIDAERMVVIYHPQDERRDETQCETGEFRQPCLANGNGIANGH